MSEQAAEITGEAITSGLAEGAVRVVAGTVVRVVRGVARVVFD
ncbi:hypothetical protein [Streptomyces sp. NPDC058657]